MPINPLTGKEFGDNSNTKGAENKTAPLNPLTGQPYQIDSDPNSQYLNTSPSEQVRVNPSTWKEYSRLTPDAFAGDELMQQKLSANQSSGEQVGNLLIGGGKLFAAGVIDGLTQWDLGQAYDMLKGANREYGNVLHDVANKLRTSAQENNPIYEQDPGSVNPSDAAWWMNQGQQLSYSMGLMAEAMGEQVALGALTAGVGNAASATKTGRLFLQLAEKLTPTMSLGQKAVIGNTAFGFGKGVQEGYLNGLNTYEETKQYYTDKGFSEEDSNRFASMAASEAYNKEVVVGGLIKALEFGTLSYNPLTKETSSILDGIKNKAAREVAKVGTEIGLQGFEEGYQNVVSNEGKYTADRLAGLTPETTFGERMKDYMSDSKMWNEVIGGMFGGVAFTGIGAIRDRVGNNTYEKFKQDQYDNFKGMRQAMTLDYVNEIAKLREQGLDNRAAGVQRQFAQNLALSAYHLDRINGIDQGGEFNNHINYLQGMIDAVTNNDEEQLNTYGITTEAQKKQVTDMYPQYIDDANRMKSLYDQEADYNQPSAIMPIVSREFQKEKYQQDLSYYESRLNELGNTFSDRNDLTDIGKRILDLQLSNENNQKALGVAELNPIDSDEYRNYVQTLKARAGLLDRIIGTLNTNQDQARTSEQVESDNAILESVNRNNEYARTNNAIEGTRRNLNKIRKELKTWRSRSFQDRVENKGFFNQINNIQTLEELKTFEEGLSGLEKQTGEIKAAILKRKGEIQAALTARERTGNINTVDPTTELVPTTEQVATPQVEISEQETTERMAQDLNNMPNTEGSHENKRKGVLAQRSASQALEQGETLFSLDEPARDYTNEFFEPTRNDKSLDSFKTYLKSLSEIIGKTPTIEDILADMQSDPDYTEQDAGLVKDLYNRYRASIHAGLRTSALKAARQGQTNTVTTQTERENINTTQSGWSLRETMIANAEALRDIDDNGEGKPKYYLGNKITIPDLKLAFLNLNYTEREAIVNGERVVWYETTDINNLQSPAILDYDRFKTGTTLSIRVGENNNVYNDKRQSVPFITLGLDPSTQEYWDKVPIEIFSGNTKVDGVFIHEPNWYSERTVALVNGDVELQKRTIEQGKAYVKQIRQALRNNPQGLNIEITQRTRGTKEFIEGGWDSLPTLNQNNPQSKIGYVTKTSPQSVKVGDQIFNSDRVLGLENLLPGSPIELREVDRDSSGPLYMASYPLRQPYSSDHYAIKSIQSAFQVYMILNGGVDQFLGMSKESAQGINNSLIKDYGIDISTPEGINTYMGMTLYIRNEVPSEDYVKSLPEGQAVAFFENGVLHFMKNISVNNQLYKRDIGPKTLRDGNINIAEGVTTNILSNIQYLQPNVTNTDGQVYHNKMPFIVNGQVVTYKSPVTGKSDYHSFLKDNMKTNIKSWNIGTQSNPNYKTFIQPVITFEEKGVVETRSTAEIPQTEVVSQQIENAREAGTNKTGIDYVFDIAPELANLGTKEQYSDYLRTIFPTSSYTDIVYHGTPTRFKNDEFRNGEEDNHRGWNYFYTNRDRAIEYGDFQYAALIDSNVDVNQLPQLYGQHYGWRTNNSALFPSQGGDEIVVMNNSQIHVLGSQTDIQGFIDWLKSSSISQMSEEERILQETKNLLDSLGLSESIEDSLYEPKLLTEGEIAYLTNSITDIPGMTEKDRSDISNWMLATIFTNLNNRYGDSFTKEEFNKEVDIKFADYMQPKLNALNTQKNTIINQLNKSYHEGLSRVLVDVNKHISNFETVRDNWNTLKNEVLELELDKYVSFKEIPIDINNTVETSDSVNENSENGNEDSIDQEQADELAENAPKYDKPGYQENYKNSVSLFVKRYMFAIPQYKRGTQSNETKKGFLGVNTYESFENNYNVLMDLISGKGQILSNTEDLKNYLSNPDSIPEQYRPMAKDVVKLIDNNKQFDNALQYALTKANVTLLMVMEQTNQKTGNTSMKVYNVNSNEVIQIIISGWREGNKHSSLINWNQEDITINSNTRERLISQYDNWVSQGDALQINTANFRNDLTNWFRDMGILLHPKTISTLIETGYFVKDPNSLKGASKNIKGIGLIKDASGMLNIISKFLKSTIEGEKSNPDIISNPGINLFDAETNMIRILANINKQFMGFVPTNSFRDNGKSIYGYENLMMDKQLMLKIKNDPDYRTKKLATIFERNSYVLQAINSSDEVRNAFNLNTAAMTAIKMQGKDVYGNWKVKDLSDIDYERFEYGSYMHQSENLNYRVGNLRFRMANMLSLVSSDKERRNMDYVPVLNLNNTYFNLEGEDFGIGDGVNANTLKDFLYSQLVEPELDRMLSHFRNAKVRGVSPNSLYNQLDYNYGAQLFLMIPELNNIMINDQRLVDYLSEETEIDKDFITRKLKDQATSIVSNYLEQQARDKFNKWRLYFNEATIQDGVITSERIGHMDDNYLKKFGQDREKQVKALSLEFSINAALVNANHFMLYLGDVANFAQDKFFRVKGGKNNFFEVDQEGRIMLGKPINDDPQVYENLVKNYIGVNLGKRAAMLIAPGNMLANSKDDGYVQLFMNDAKRVASNIENIIELFYPKEYTQEYRDKISEMFNLNNELADQQRNTNIDPITLNKRDKLVSELSKKFPDLAAYFEIESTDAQEYTTWKEHLDIILRQGRMSQSQYDRIYDSLSKGRQLDTKDLKLVFQPIKPVFTGKIMEDIGDGTYRNRTLYIKSSSFPLLVQLTQGTEFDGLRRDMEAIQNKTGKNVRASYNTANKVGSVSKPTTVWDEQGRYIPNAFGNIDQLTDDLNNDRSQLGKILPREYFRIQQDVPFKSSKKTSDEISIGTQMMKVLFSDGVRDLLGKEAFLNYQNAFINWSNNERQKLHNDLGVKDGKIDVSKLRELLLKEAQQRNYTKQDVQILSSILDDLQFESPLWLSANSNRYEAFMNAIIGARLINLKLPGASFVSGSEEGWQSDPSQAFTKGEIIYLPNWDGKLKDNQALIPSKFRVDGKLIDLRSDEWSTINERGVRVLKSNKFDPELLNLTAFRIPTSGHVSGTQIEIVGFLPYNAGDLSIVSKNLTKQMGQDFDVDKLNTYWQHHLLNDEGVLTPIDAENSNDITKINQNIIIRTHSQVFGSKSPAIQKKIQKVLSTDFAESQADLITKLITQSTSQTIFSILSPEYQKTKMNLGAVGKSGIGTYSNYVTFHGLSQQVNNPVQILEAVMDEAGNVDYVVPKLTIGKFISDGILGKIDTLDGNRTIADVFAERQNTATDNEKLQVMGRVGVDNNTINFDSLLSALGFDQDTFINDDGEKVTVNIPYFILSQPIMRDYVEEMKNANSQIAEFDLNKKQTIISKLIEKYGGRDLYNDLSSNEAESLTGKNLYQSIKYNSQQNEGDRREFNKIQLATLDTFIKYNAMAEKVQQLQSHLNIQRSGLGKSFFEAESKRDNLLNLLGLGVGYTSPEGFMINNVSEYVGDVINSIAAEENDIPLDDNLFFRPTTPTGVILGNGVREYHDLFRQFFPQSSQLFNNTVDRIISNMGADNKVASKKIELKNQVLNALKKYVLSSYTKFIGEDKQAERKRLLFDTNNNQSLASYLYSLKYDPRYGNIVAGNSLLSQLEFSLNKDNTPSLIIYRNSRGEDIQEEYKYKAMLNLLADDPNLPNFNGQSYSANKLVTDMVAYSFLIGGVQEANEFIKYIPLSILKTLNITKDMRDIHNGLLSNDSSWYGSVLGSDGRMFEQQFFQHNPKRAKRLTEDQIDGLNTSNFNENTTRLKIKDSLIDDLSGRNGLPQYISIYNTNKKGKGNSKYQLYKNDEGTTYYNRIPSLGTTGMVEYTIGDNITPLIDNKIGYGQIRNVEDKPDYRVNYQVQSPTIDVFNIKAGNIDDTIDLIVNSNIPGLSLFLNSMKEFANTGTRLTINNIGSSKDSYRAYYNINNNSIIFNPSTLSENKENVARTFVKEYMHSITANELLKYFNYDPTTRTSSLKENVTIPAYVDRLNRLFNDVQNKLANNPSYISMVESIRNMRGLSEEEFATYGGINIFEFVSEIFGDPDFQRTLANTPYKQSGQSMLQIFKQIISDLLRSLGIKITATQLGEGIDATLDFIVQERAANPNNEALFNNVDQQQEILNSTQTNNSLSTFRPNLTGDQINEMKAVFNNNNYAEEGGYVRQKFTIEGNEFSLELTGNQLAWISDNIPTFKELAKFAVEQENTNMVELLNKLSNNPSTPSNQNVFEHLKTCL